MHVLPALPTEWKAGGEVKGLRARGGFVVTDMKWADGKIEKLAVKSTVGGNLRLRTATPLTKADGTALSVAEGNNTNPLMQPYGMPEPIVKDAGKIPATTLPDTYLYDISTQAGEEITLVGGIAGIVPVSVASCEFVNDDAVYNLNGQRVGEGYHGVVVVKGKKYVK